MLLGHATELMVTVPALPASELRNATPEFA
jgi:hypothetical protein